MPKLKPCIGNTSTSFVKILSYIFMYCFYSQIEQLESLNSNDDTEMEEMRVEFTKRIGETDKKLQNVIKERDQLKDLLQQTEERLTMR